MLECRSRIACSIVVGALLVAMPAKAQQSEAPTAAQLTEARERFASGRRLEEAGQFAEALTQFEIVARVKTTPQVRFHIALCLMHTGKRVEALANFRLAVRDAGADATNVVNEAKGHIATLEKEIAIVTVDVPSAAPNTTIAFDDRVVVVGEAFDAEPGTHRVVLQREGKTLEERELKLQAGERSRIQFISPEPPNVSATNHVPDKPVTNDPPVVPPPVQTIPPRQTTPSVPTNPRKVASFVAFGVTGASLIGLGTFAILRADRLSELEAACPSFTGCSRDLEPIVREGKTYSTGVNGFAVVAGASAIVGVVLYVFSLGSTKRDGRATNVQIRPMVGMDHGFVSLEAKF